MSGSLNKHVHALGPLILASASPRRRELLAQLEVPFRVVSSDAAEAHDENFTARELCEINAYRKARAVAQQNPNSLILGADTLVYLGTQLFGKPRDLDEATAMLSALSGRTHQVVTGVCLLHLRAHRLRTFSETTEVTFRELDAGAIKRYLSMVHTLDKAGAYAIQEHGSAIVERIVGSYSNVVGLPLERLQSEFATWARVSP